MPPREQAGQAGHAGHPQQGTARRRNPRGQGQLLKEQLVQAATKLLATLDQPETITLRQVAREVGVAPASIYSHFPDLSALIQHVLRLRYEELARRMDEASADASDPLTDLVARCGAYVHWGVEQPGHYRVLVGGRMPEDLVPSGTHGPGARLLESVIAALAAVTDDDPPQTTATPEQRWRAGLLLWTAMHGLVTLYNDHGAISWPPLNDLLADLLSLHTGRPARHIATLLGSTEA